MFQRGVKTPPSHPECVFLGIRKGLKQKENDMTDTAATRATSSIEHDLGTFEGFNFREQSAIDRTLTAEEAVNWDHDREGEAEFWPSGDHAGVALVFKGQSSVTCSQLLALDQALSNLGGDDIENFLRIHYAVNLYGMALDEVTPEKLDEHSLHIFRGTSFCGVRKDAAFELFELYYPELYRAWEGTPCDGLRFDPDDFLDSPGWSVEEVQLSGNEVALIVAAQ